MKYFHACYRISKYYYTVILLELLISLKWQNVFSRTWNICAGSEIGSIITSVPFMEIDRRTNKLLTVATKRIYRTQYPTWLKMPKRNAKHARNVLVVSPLDAADSLHGSAIILEGDLVMRKFVHLMRDILHELSYSDLTR